MIIHDELPPHPPLIQVPDIDMEDDIDAHSESHLPDRDTHSPNSTGPFRTECDSYRVYRQYSHGKPSITPDHFYSLSDVLDSPYLSLDPSSPSSILGLTFQKVQKTVKVFKPFFAPFRNPTVYTLSRGQAGPGPADFCWP